MTTVTNYGFAWDKSNADRYVLFFADLGPYLTEDNGQTFRTLRAPRGPENAFSTVSGAISPTQPNTMITASGSWDVQKILITRNAGALSPTWESVPGTQNAFYGAIVFHPTNGNIAYAGKYRFNKMETENRFEELPRWIHAMYPGNGNIVYSVDYATEYTRVWKSVDGGFTWTNPYPDVPYPSINILNRHITIAPNDSDKIFIPIRTIGLVVLTKTGYSLRNQAHGLTKSDLPYSSVDTSRVAVDPRNPNLIYTAYDLNFIGQSNGIFRSTDGGNTWTKILFNLGDRFPVEGMSVNPHNGYIYIGGKAGSMRMAPP